MKTYYVIKIKALFFLVIWSLIAVGCTGESPKAEEVESPKVTKNETEEPNPLEGLPDVVATVNGSEILKGEIEKIYRVISSQAKMTGQELNSKDMVESVVEQMISAELIKQESARQNITPSADEAEKEFKELQSRFPDVESFEKAITEKGLTLEELKEEIREQLAVKKVLEKEVEGKITISKKDIEKFYNENQNYFKTEESVRAAHILLKTEEGYDKKKVDEVRKSVEEILARAKKGDDFSELAKKHSEGPSAPAGGDLGFFTKGQMVKPFEEAAFALKKGEISGTVKTRFGFHVIKVLDRKKAGTAALEEVEESVHNYLKRVEGEKLFAEYVERLRSNAKVEKNI